MRCVALRYDICGDQSRKCQSGGEGVQDFSKVAAVDTFNLYTDRAYIVNAYRNLTAMSSTLSTTHRSDLVVSLEKHNATFTQLLSLIPSKFYVAPDPDEVGLFYRLDSWV